MPDNLALAFGIWGLYFLQLWLKTRKNSAQLFVAVFLALATLVKLPYIIYFSAFAWVALFPMEGAQKKRQLNRLKDIGISALIAIVSLIPVFLWYGWVIPTWEGNGIVQGIFGMTPEQTTD